MERENFNGWIINYIKRTGHEDGAAISEDELDSLVVDLFLTLDIPVDQIVYDTDMLSELEERILAYYPALYELSDLEEMRLAITKFTREIIAYFGKLVILTTKWEWWYHESSSLMGTSVTDGRTRYPLGNLISVFLDNMRYYSEKYKKAGESYLVNEYLKRFIKKNYSDAI